MNTASPHPDRIHPIAIRLTREELDLIEAHRGTRTRSEVIREAIVAHLLRVQ